jgi:hypothetical protein
VVHARQGCEVEDVGGQATDRLAVALVEGLAAAAGEARGRVPLARLVLNPRSFAQTVENLFALSFAVRWARARTHPQAALLLLPHQVCLHARVVQGPCRTPAVGGVQAAAHCRRAAQQGVFGLWSQRRALRPQGCLAPEGLHACACTQPQHA